MINLENVRDHLDQLSLLHTTVPQLRDYYYDKLLPFEKGVVESHLAYCLICGILYEEVARQLSPVNVIAGVNPERVRNNLTRTLGDLLKSLVGLEDLWVPVLAPAGADLSSNYVHNESIDGAFLSSFSASKDGSFRLRVSSRYNLEGKQLKLEVGERSSDEESFKLLLSDSSAFGPAISNESAEDALSVASFRFTKEQLAPMRNSIQRGVSITTKVDVV
jgi:hypothetical protein